MHGLHSLILLMCEDLHMWWQDSEDKNNFFDCKSYEYTWDTVLYIVYLSKSVYVSS